MTQRCSLLALAYANPHRAEITTRNTGKVSLVLRHIGATICKWRRDRLPSVFIATSALCHFGHTNTTRDPTVLSYVLNNLTVALIAACTIRLMFEVMCSLVSVLGGTIPSSSDDI